MSYADDIPTVGHEDPPDWFYGEVSQLLLIKHLGELRYGDQALHFLEGAIYRDEKGIHLQATKAYVEDMVELLGLQNGKSVGTPGTTTTSSRGNGSSTMDYEQHRV